MKSFFNTARTPLSQDANGIWRAEIELPPPGRYRYKFVINGERWVEDPSHGLQEPDEFGGLNSVLNVTSTMPGALEDDDENL